MTVSRAPFDSTTRKYAFIDGENLRGTFDHQHSAAKDRGVVSPEIGKPKAVWCSPNS